MEYDLIIIGGGPAGLTAAIYAARYKLNLLLISKDVGGLAAVAHKVCNFPSYVEITGFELSQKILKQVQELNVQIVFDEVTKIEKSENGFLISTSEENYKTKKIIFAGGTTRNRLNVPGEGKLVGRGVSYCATCDATFFKEKTVAVIGGSDASLTAALLLSEYSKKVYIIHRSESFFRAEPFWVELVKKNKKIFPIFSEEIKEITGKDKVEGVKLKSGEILPLEGIFIEIGSSPKIDFLKSLNLKLSEKGFIITDKEQKTNVSGFFAAGDITNNTLKQIVTAAGEGATAAFSVYNEIKREEGRK
jgi:thioredoxin reductase (NADPH)